MRIRNLKSSAFIILNKIQSGKRKRDKWAEFREGACFGFSIATGIIGFFSMSSAVAKSFSGAGIASTIACSFV